MFGPTKSYVAAGVGQLAATRVAERGGCRPASRHAGTQLECRCRHAGRRAGRGRARGGDDGVGDSPLRRSPMSRSCQRPRARSSPRAAIRREPAPDREARPQPRRDLRGAGLGRRGERADIGVAGQVDWGGRQLEAGEGRAAPSPPAVPGSGRQPRRAVGAVRSRSGSRPTRAARPRAETPVITNAANSQTSSTTWATPTTAPPPCRAAAG